jgi:hypothetical protein
MVPVGGSRCPPTRLWGSLSHQDWLQEYRRRDDVRSVVYPGRWPVPENTSRVSGSRTAQRQDGAGGGS